MLFIVWLAITWLLFHWIHSFITSRHPPSPSANTTLTLSWASFHLSTTSLNSLPSFLLRPWTRSRRKAKHDYEDVDRPWGALWDVGAVVGVVGIVVAQGVLVWATIRSLSVLVRMLGHQDAPPWTRRLVRRGVEQGAKTVATASGLVLRPVIPGLTQPLSSLPLMLTALFAAQSLHELGHGVAAASENIPLLSTGIHLYVLLPTFYVALPSSSSSPATDLRIATAGIWHNLLLSGVLWLLTTSGSGRFLAKGLFREMEKGVVVVDVDPHSPLYALLPPSSLILTLDDLELDSTRSPALLWSSYLSSPTSTLLSSSSTSTTTTTTTTYNTLGWCLPLTSFSSTVFPPCCSTVPPTTPSGSHTLCFSIKDDEVVSRSCLDPSAFFYPTPTELIPQRCLSSSSCTVVGEGCAGLSGREVRIGVAPAGRAKEGRTVVFQGEKGAIARAVQTTSLLPRLSFLPLSLSHVLASFFSQLLLLSLSLAFFNLLPLPSLDGLSILHSFFLTITSTSTLEDGLGISVEPNDEAILERVLTWMRKMRWVRKLAERGELVEMRLKVWTVGVGGVLVLATGVVEWLESGRR